MTKKNSKDSIYVFEMKIALYLPRRVYSRQENEAGKSGHPTSIFMLRWALKDLRAMYWHVFLDFQSMIIHFTRSPASPHLCLHWFHFNPYALLPPSRWFPLLSGFLPASSFEVTLRRENQDGVPHHFYGSLLSVSIPIFHFYGNPFPVSISL